MPADPRLGDGWLSAPGRAAAGERTIEDQSSELVQLRNEADTTPHGVRGVSARGVDDLDAGWHAELVEGSRSAGPQWHLSRGVAPGARPSSSPSGCPSGRAVPATGSDPAAEGCWGAPPARSRGWGGAAAGPAGPTGRAAPGAP